MKSYFDYYGKHKIESSEVKKKMYKVESQLRDLERELNSLKSRVSSANQTEFIEAFISENKKNFPEIEMDILSTYEQSDLHAYYLESFDKEAVSLKNWISRKNLLQYKIFKEQDDDYIVKGRFELLRREVSSNDNLFSETRKWDRLMYTLCIEAIDFYYPIVQLQAVTIDVKEKIC